MSQNIENVLSFLQGHGISADEPNDVLGDETCVRMRGGMYNDALCDDSNGFNKREQQVFFKIIAYQALNSRIFRLKIHIFSNFFLNSILRDTFVNTRTLLIQPTIALNVIIIWMLPHGRP